MPDERGPRRGTRRCNSAPAAESGDAPPKQNGIALELGSLKLGRDRAIVPNDHQPEKHQSQKRESQKHPNLNKTGATADPSDLAESTTKRRERPPMVRWPPKDG